MSHFLCIPGTILTPPPAQANPQDARRRTRAPQARDRNAVKKRWWPTRRIFPILGPSCRLARGASRRSVSGTLFSRRRWGMNLPPGATKPPQNGAQAPHQLAISTSRQVGGPAPRRAPLPRRRVRRGCAEPAPPAGPSGAAGSGQPLGTLRSPPRPRGGANRAGERVTPLFLLEPPGPVAQRT